MALGRVLFWKVTNNGSNLLLILLLLLCEFNATTFVLWQNLTLASASGSSVLTYINQTSRQPQLTSDLCFFNLGEAFIEILCWNTLVSIQRTFFNQERDESSVHVIITELAAFLWKFWLMEVKNSLWSLVLNIIPQRHSLPIKSTFPGAPNSEVLQQLLLCMSTCFVHFFLLREQCWVVHLCTDDYSNLAQTGFVVFQVLCYGCNLVTDKLLKAKLPQ